MRFNELLDEFKKIAQSMGEYTVDVDGTEGIVRDNIFVSLADLADRHCDKEFNNNYVVCNSCDIVAGYDDFDWGATLIEEGGWLRCPICGEAQ